MPTKQDFVLILARCAISRIGVSGVNLGIGAAGTLSIRFRQDETEPCMTNRPSSLATKHLPKWISTPDWKWGGTIAFASMTFVIPIPGAPTVVVCDNEFVLGCSRDRENNGDARDLDKFGLSMRDNTLRPVCGLIVLLHRGSPSPPFIVVKEGSEIT